MFKSILIIAGLFSAAALAGESGIIINGKKTVLFREGKKIGELPNDSRKPSSAANIVEGTATNRELFYQEVDGIVCFSLNSSATKEGGPGLSCVVKPAPGRP